MKKAHAFVALLTLGASLVGCSDQKVASATPPAAGNAKTDAEFPEVLATIAPDAARESARLRGGPRDDR